MPIDITCDTESAGLHGLPTLIQWAEGDGPVQLHPVWERPAEESIELIQHFCANNFIGFNVAHDWFMLTKLYTTLIQLDDYSVYPEDIIHEMGILEERGRWLNICLKPQAALDVMLIARRGPLQVLMDRDDIKIRRVPTPLAWHLAHELERRIYFDEILFAKRKDPFAPKWRVYDVKKDDGSINPDFKDVKLKFMPSGGLKNLYRHAFKIKDKIFTYRDIEVDRKFWPNEYGFAPFALAVAPNAAQTKDWSHHRRKSDGRIVTERAWPDVIKPHILHWGYNKDARKYAADDVNYTRRLRVEYFDNAPVGDRDSNLACMVASCRWRGYAIDEPKIRELRELAISKINSGFNSTNTVRRYVTEKMDETERVIIQSTTKKVVLEEIAKWMDDEGKKHPAAVRAQEVLDSRLAAKEKELYDKLLMARRFHASFKVIGALSNRMSGDNKLNPQGIKHTKVVRGAFPLADKDRAVLRATAVMIGEDPDVYEQEMFMRLCGGDFKSFEVSLAAKVFNDPKLNELLLSGVKAHGLMGMELNPGMSYEEVCASEGTDDDWYDRGKKGFFLKCYFGEAYTFNKKLGIPMEVAELANKNFDNKFREVKNSQDRIRQMFTSLHQPGGLGTAVYWKDPAEYAESFLGFKRYFTLEQKVTRALFDMAQNPPPIFKSVTIKVQRRERVQTAGGATQSALYAAAFAIAAAVIRAAGNHYIQSPGAEITKATQHSVWELQPSGIGPFHVMPMNVHDEIMCPTKPGLEAAVESQARKTVAYYREQVPLLAIDWMTNISSWAAKKGEPVESQDSSGGSIQSAT